MLRFVPPSKMSGTVIGANDLFIAAHARCLGLTLVTNNAREFGRVPGLKVENWAEPDQPKVQGRRSKLR